MNTTDRKKFGSSKWGDAIKHLPSMLFMIDRAFVEAFQSPLKFETVTCWTRLNGWGDTFLAIHSLPKTILLRSQQAWKAARGEFPWTAAFR
jgi:hypothetical protein